MSAIVEFRQEVKQKYSEGIPVVFVNQITRIFCPSLKILDIY